MGVVGAEIVAQFVPNHVEVPTVIVEVVAVAGFEVGAEACCIGWKTHHVQVGDAARAGVLPAGQQMHDVALDAGEIRIGQPFKPKAVEHVAGVIDKGRIRIRSFPHVDVRSLDVDERIKVVRIDRIDTGHDGQGPFDCGVAIVTEGAVGMVVDVDCHLHAVSDLRSAGGLLLQSHGHHLAAGTVFVHTALEFHRFGSVGQQKEHVLAVYAVAQGADVILSAFPLQRAHHKFLHDHQRSAHARRNDAIRQEFRSVHLFLKLSAFLRATDEECIGEGKKRFQFYRQLLPIQKRQDHRPLVVFVCSNVLKSCIRKLQANVVFRAYGRDFARLKFNGFEKRDRLLCLCALGVCWEWSSKQKGNSESLEPDYCGESAGIAHGVTFSLKLMKFPSHLCTRGHKRVHPLVP